MMLDFWRGVMIGTPLSLGLWFALWQTIEGLR